MMINRLIDGWCLRDKMDDLMMPGLMINSLYIDGLKWMILYIPHVMMVFKGYPIEMDDDTTHVFTADLSWEKKEQPKAPACARRGSRSIRCGPPRGA